MKTALASIAGILVLICGLVVCQPPAPAATEPVNQVTVPMTRPYRGVVMQVQSLDDLPAYEKAVNQIADVGADTILIEPRAMQENGESCQIFTDFRYTPTPRQLGELIDLCRAKHLRVGLMPLVLLSHPRGQEWRGKIKPSDWRNWFESYREMIGMFADVAQSHGAELFVVGSELTSSESNLDEWTRTIDLIRSRFKGNLT